MLCLVFAGELRSFSCGSGACLSGSACLAANSTATAAVNVSALSCCADDRLPASENLLCE